MMTTTKRIVGFCLGALSIVSCGKEGTEFETQGFLYADGDVEHEMIVLGDRLDNPYKTENIQKAFSALYPTKSRDAVSTTDLYVRFLPSSQSEYDMLKSLGLNLLDHPMDYEIVTEGDWYHDPAIEDDRITWLYSVVPADFSFPSVRYEIIDECFISDNSDQTKAMTDVDWEAVEAEAYRLTGNSDLLDDVALTRADKSFPTGRITIVDPDANGGQPFGLAGVMVSCNSFVKFSTAYTDRDGYYTMSKKYSANPRYRIVFKNEKGFNLGLNLILVPASTSTLGKGSPEGMSAVITSDCDDKLFRRAAVSNAAYDYYARCSQEDMNLPEPPSDLRIWLFGSLDVSSAVMIHQGTIVDNSAVRSFLGEYAPLIKVFAPDITIGTANHDSYLELYDSTVHELSHASHFRQVGRQYWEQYIFYILKSYLTSGGMTYGDGTLENAGHCEVGEMWAYFLESVMHKDRYGGSVPAYGTSYWFYPQILRYLEDRGLTRAELFAALQSDVSGKEALQKKLMELYPEESIMIEQVFNRYR